MKGTVLITTLVAGFLTAISPAVARAPYSAVSIIVRLVDYVGNVYTEPSDSVFVYFSGEPVRFEILLVNNRGEDPVRLVARPEVPSNFIVSRLAGAPFDVRLAPEVRKSSTVSGSAPFDWSSEMVLSARESLILSGEITTQLPPGEHTATLSTGIKDDRGLSPAPQANRLRLEVRARSDETKPEEFRRNAVRAFLAQDYAAAEAWIDALLKIYPPSYAAYQLRGDIAERQRDRPRARAAYQRAVALLQSGADQKYLTLRAGVPIHSPLDALLEKLRAIDGR